LHPYTQELLSAVPIPDPRRRRRGAPREKEKKEAFSSYCAHQQEDPPQLIEAAPEHFVACHLRPIERERFKGA
ncbi:MAG TPA: hypothetical protein VI382_02620, partial [Candidatus Manganitrophaceae bacterium]|nr:hypothetical protein [Candidatus Manganitrophaceae bacterium]